MAPNVSTTENGMHAAVDQLSIDLIVASSKLVRASARLSETQVPPAVWRALAILDEYGEMRVGDFAVRDRCSQPTATAMFKRLEGHGLVERVTDPEDRRAVRIRLSEKGVRRLGELRDGVANALRDRMESLDGRERQSLRDGVAVVERLLSDVDE
ncbi:MarR family winged helix-turn-helix transcriptional regulator [Spelaeicoccus albus]|uniref:DNA-binding MarR family transcriptional regulator n=1 Tax=Spelaeicoccus albus TaxID=1280376 RepID=A0A7Z0D262_9MICO|nr:MarR family transcriptional regulator [Spelaeicoccus albus]NYI67463.1 DNA-binding MarR family transcriptional regulator [Spelaeicoccus albus]